MPSICDRITDPVKKKRCKARLSSEQSTSPDEAVKKRSKAGSATTKSGRY